MSDRDDWGAIVIGSGLGGLTTAAYLAANGVRPLVLEQADRVGGCSHVFRRKRVWEFDVGVHYVGEVHGEGTIGLVLSGLGLDKRIEFLPMDRDGFDTLVFPDLTFAVPAGWDAYLRRLTDTFPAQENGLRLCVDMMRERMGGFPLAQAFDIAELGPDARAVLAAQSADYGVPPSRAPIAAHGMVIGHYLSQGAFYPRGGGQVFAGHLLDVVTSHGGAVRIRARVERILTAGGRAVGVALSDGTEFRAPIVVSNADLKQTYRQLLDTERVAAATRARVEDLRMSAPMFTVYLGLDVDLSELIPNTNYWTHPDFDIERVYRIDSRRELPAELSLFISSSSRKDPGNPRVAPPGHSTLEIMAVSPTGRDFWGLTEDVANDNRYRRDPQYRSAKHRLATALIEQAEKYIPDIRGHIVYQEAATPLTHRRYTLSSEGCCYGIALAAGQFGPDRPTPRTEISGLFLTGSNTTSGPGIGGTMGSGLHTASIVLQRDLREEILAGRVFTDTSKLTAGGPDWDPLEACRKNSV
ncbi:NAD(P)/FAD-dependent oxidoreductase [Nocardia sp. CDC159]|uniref:NAD(P)/FAD-dependent oxidoreductase n=1 Tax=Nocardia pulmonis TaxID=2951408 RepID=A0A9X2E5F6_9NOCA|nr:MULTISPECIES: NAD(P)/FAD-dependent oxidoreductase [Nocardia]MCM6773175.1 NAD(P)/FAD-dependent oxidoreductase [Nocardia pulmonis]MCM6785522.1 NAD(P)/FAD-dependent oxidoreductase [Nocardia sp. CDC159]